MYKRQPCPGYSVGLEMMQWCRRASGARAMLAERTWRTAGRCYRHRQFQDLKCLDETRSFRMRIIKREEAALGSIAKRSKQMRDRKKERGNKIYVDVALCAGVFKIHKTILKLQVQ